MTETVAGIKPYDSTTFSSNPPVGTQHGNFNKKDSAVVVSPSKLLVSSARWVFISNNLVAYWPFSITTHPRRRSNSFSSALPPEKVTPQQQQTLYFAFSPFGLFLSFTYIALNVFYVIYYFIFRFGEEGKVMLFFDLIVVTIWDLLVVVGVTAHRLYGLVKISRFRLFWAKMISIVTQCTIFSCSERDTELALGRIRRWTIRWFVVFAVLGVTNCLSVVYTNTIDSSVNAPTVILYVYLEAVISMHNSSGLMLIYLIKILTHGFFTCRRKLDQLSYLTQLHPPSPALNEGSQLTKARKESCLNGILNLVEELEGGVESFNKLFGFSLFLDVFLGFWQVMFAMYFLHENSIREVAFAVNMLVPILMYPACLIFLCVAASQMKVECQMMIQSFQRLTPEGLSKDESYKIQLLVSRISAAPPSIQVAQLFQIQESLLGSALNALATYFIVLVQMKQIKK